MLLQYLENVCDVGVTVQVYFINYGGQIEIPFTSTPSFCLLLIFAEKPFPKDNLVIDVRNQRAVIFTNEKPGLEMANHLQTTQCHVEVFTILGETNYLVQRNTRFHRYQRDT